MHCLLQLLETDEEPLSKLHNVTRLKLRVIALLLVELDLLELYTLLRTLTTSFECIRGGGLGSRKVRCKAVSLLRFFVQVPLEVTEL